jgi:hypothetical protein
MAPEADAKMIVMLASNNNLSCRVSSRPSVTKVSSAIVDSQCKCSWCQFDCHVGIQYQFPWVAKDQVDQGADVSLAVVDVMPI